MNVTFRHFGEQLASSRYRSIIPARQLRKAGIEPGADWLVIGKHGWDWSIETKGYKRVCFDICDDHFGGKHAQHYRSGALAADMVTCNSEEMRRVIKAEIDIDALVIPDPYEQREEAPRIFDRLLWFGHSSNLVDLAPWITKLDHLEVVTNLESNAVTVWSQQTMDAAFSRAGLVIIPTGKSMAKSANRAVESLRRGLFVVAGYLPAYADLGVYIGDIKDGVDWALDHPGEVVKRIKAAQEYIADEYGPERIGRLWLRALS